MQLLKYLRSPYPIVETKWKIIVGISVFVAFFLLIFQPFGISSIEAAGKLGIILGYGGVTFIVLLFNLYFLESIFPEFFAEKNWTVMKQIGWLCWILVTIGLGNYFYSIFTIPSIKAGWQNLITFQAITLVVGIFPVVIITIVSHNVYFKKYIDLANSVEGKLDSALNENSNHKQKKVILKNESGKEEIVLKTEELLFIESFGNYITIHWKSGERTEKLMLRNTLKKIREQLADCKTIIQCHRAFMVNINQVIKVRGNAQGYQLSLKSSNENVPVSRSFIASFNAVFNQ